MLIFLSLIAGAFVSEDAALLSAAALGISGEYPLYAAMAGAITGIFLSDFAVFILGGFTARTGSARWMVKLGVEHDTLVRLERSFQKYGLLIVVISRFFPGTRVPVCFAAGYLKLPTLKFSVFMLAGSLIWSVFVFWILKELGEHVLERYTSYGSSLIVTVLVLLLVLIATARIFRSLLKQDGWLKFKIALRRWTRFEFLPTSIAYLPVFLATPYFAIRSRGHLMAWTQVNPALPFSGFCGESKSDILQRLESAGAPVAPWFLLPQGDLDVRLAAVSAFSQEQFPIVLKPDQGERGKGVCIADTLDDVREYLRETHEACIVQRFVGGEEYGVLFHRAPESNHVSVLSIHGKRLTSVQGDGIRTLRELILVDARAAYQWQYFFNTHADKLHSIPESNELVLLTRIGNHCKGTVFLDRRDLICATLEQRIQKWIAHTDGIYLGRFDVKAVNDTALQQGEFSILEMNGVTSEPGHIYDPSGSFIAGWAGLYRHWSLAFATGSYLMRHNSLSPPSLLQFVRLLRSRE